MKASAGEIKARWAYSELFSSRLGQRLAAVLPARLQDCRKHRPPFEDLTEADHKALVHALKTLRPASFIDLIDAPGSTHYELSQWTAAQLLGCLTLPQFGPVRYFQFLAGRHEDRSDKPTIPADPRLEAATIPFDENFSVEFPVIALKSREHYILIDGYLRSILWLRNPLKTLPVWVPAEAT